MKTSPLNLFKLLALLPTKPAEFCDRVRMKCEVSMDPLLRTAGRYQPWEWNRLLEALEAYSGKDMNHFLSECDMVDFEKDLRERMRSITSVAPFPIAHNADLTLARLAFAAIRMCKPAIVLETGTAYGVMSAFILKALEVNGQGILHSVDLPPLGTNADKFVGILIPEALKHRWRLHRGVSKRVLPGLLRELERVDVFIHDSLHTYKNMRSEFLTVAPYLTPGAIVISDDVEKNAAFYEWLSHAPVVLGATIKKAESDRLFGVSVHRQ